MATLLQARHSSGDEESAETCNGSPASSSSPVEGDYFDGVFKYIQQMLMEEDGLEYKPCMFQDSMALQAAEKSFYDALTLNHPPSPSWTQITDMDPPMNKPSPLMDDLHSSLFETGFFLLPSRGRTQTHSIKNASSEGGRNDETKKHGRDVSSSCGEERSNKQFAINGDSQEPEETEKYDKALLCPSMNPAFYDGSSLDPSYLSLETSRNAAGEEKYIQGPKRGRPKGSKNGAKTKEIVDLGNLLSQCAQAEASGNKKSFQQWLTAVRLHSSPYGDARERVAHCFANALEARSAAAGTSLYTTSKWMSSVADYLKAYQVYITACPFKRMSNIFANKSIAKRTREAEKIHIIDFGILYGFQWPCIIHGISLRPGGPPKLRMTGIDFPQPGFRPAQRVEETGRRLENFARRFNVPFEYNAIAKQWETITPDDLKIDPSEMLVVNCLYRLKNVPDETVVENNNPRDCILKLIKKLNPKFFVQGVVNASYNAPFFTTRFRESYFHYSAMFDMFEATMAGEDEGRVVVEQEAMGREILNVVACEGRERVERPETYKQWRARNERAGLRLLPLNQEIMREVKAKVRMGYHRDFSVDEDGGGEWMLQSWKGRVAIGAGS
ncbi:unnamed protein product [Cuscuta campestris]|uniref:Uncharacterized protein n=1 Tax=Cuscuta campestris TaxID=132261 RepID=A0A484NCA3_9ASTE|nr:unnamed protein product [Cuscuta campestris]